MLLHFKEDLKGSNNWSKCGGKMHSATSFGAALNKGYVFAFLAKNVNFWFYAGVIDFECENGQVHQN
jgi:hypothetical protein